jgi:hypothetical protein
VLLFGALKGAEYVYTLAEELEASAGTMTLIEMGEATADALTRLSYPVEEVPGTGEWAIWFTHPDPPLGILLAVEGDTLILAAEVGMAEATGRDAWGEGRTAKRGAHPGAAWASSRRSKAAPKKTRRSLEFETLSEGAIPDSDSRLLL